MLAAVFVTLIALVHPVTSQLNSDSGGGNDPHDENAGFERVLMGPVRIQITPLLGDLRVPMISSGCWRSFTQPPYWTSYLQGGVSRPSG